MTPIDIVRAMLAEHAQKHGIDVSKPWCEAHYQSGVGVFRHDVLTDVIEALELADAVPRLEWKHLSGDNDDCDIRRDFRGEDCYLDLWTNASFGVVTVRIYDDNGHTKVEFYDRINRLPDEGEETFASRCERVAELVIYRHRQMLAEIGRVP